MSSWLSNLVDNLSEGVHNDKCTDCKSCLDYMITKDDKLIFRYFECKNIYKKNFNKDLIKSVVMECCNGDINKLLLLLRKGNIHMNTWIAGKDLMKHFYLAKKFFTIL